MAEDQNNTTTITTKSQLKVWFKTQSKPLQAQYYAWMDSYWHKSESIPQSKILGLSDSLANKADADQLQHYAKVDASNIGFNQGAWRTALGINDITPPDVDLTNYYTKPEVDGLLENVSVDLSNYYTSTQTESAITSKGYITAAALTGYATESWVNTQTTPATQTEVEASTGTESQPLSAEPITENRKFLSLFNFFKLIKKLRYIHLLPNSATATANRFWSNGVRLFYANNSAVASTVAYTSDLPTTFDYTISSNFTTSQLKTAVESAGLIFRGIHVNLIIGSNNVVCTIDNGALIGGIWSMERTGSGSITFNTTAGRTLDAGIFNIVTLSGNESSTCVFQHKTAKDYIKIKNF